MTNAEKFQEIFKKFATEMWAFPEKDFLTWLNAEYREPTTKNDLALIHTEGLDEEIRCTMCTNYMKSDRGCDGSCVVDKDMYKAVMDAIEKRIQPITKNDLVPRNVVERIIKSPRTKEQMLLVLNSLPSQEPRKGYWLRRPHVYGVTYCSICDFELKIDNTNYCPHCGAKMESEVDNGNDD